MQLRDYVAIGIKYETMLSEVYQIMIVDLVFHGNGIKK
jgi:hypothetical protein